MQLVCTVALQRNLEGPLDEVERRGILRRARIPGENLGSARLDERTNAVLGNSVTCIFKQARPKDVAELDRPGALVRRVRHVIDARVHKAGRPRPKARDAAERPVLQRPALNIEELDLLVPVPGAAAMGVSVKLRTLEDVGPGVRYLLEKLLVPAL